MNAIELAAHRTSRVELSVQPDRPLVSVVIPTRGRRQELGRLLSSLAAQDTAEQVEVIVVDNPIALNRGWLSASSWPFPLGYVHVTRPNRGLSRNAGAAHANGRWLLFCDSDIRLSDAAISTLVNSAAELPRTIVMANVLFPPREPRSLGTHLCDVPAYFRRYRRQRRLGILSFLEFVSCCFMIGSDDFDTLGGFDGGFVRYGYEDVEFGCRAQQLGLGFELSTARAYHHKQLDPAGVLQRAWEAGRSAVRLVDLHPGIETLMPLGVAATTNNTLPAGEPFDITTALTRAEVIEGLWAGLRERGAETGRRGLLDDARVLYRDIHGFGHLHGVAAEINSRRGAAE